MTLVRKPVVALSLAALLLSTACAAVGPDPSAVPTPALQANFAEGAAVPVGQVVTQAFWRGYNDATLTRLIETGLATNLDILAANERIRAAQADVAATQPLAAQLGGDSASASRMRAGGDGQPVTTTTGASLSAGFVFDLFGGARRAREGAEAAEAAARAQAEVTRLAWLAEVISAYSDARYYQQALALTRDTIAAREATLSVNNTMLGLGSATDLDVAQTTALLQTARADLPNFEALFNAQVYRLSTLLNLQAAPLMAQMRRGAPALRIPPGPGTGVPAELLQNRPDVRAARFDVMQALAAVGVATADMLPSLSLSGTVSDTGGADSWRFGPALTLPVANQGLLQATRARRQSEARQADLAWRSQITAAVEDVQVGQSNLRRYRQRVSALDQAAASYENAYGLARTTFQAGATALVDLLDADRQRAAARLQAASARNDAAKAWAALQIATGAGAAVTGTAGGS
ncbi:outer membrane protein, multidrug efflux system [Pseudosulfitobacter pseudonitzschiae]|uniref:RND transporter n=1 Tax=Pseudosulfitobacter pseudonitzschiae TaxID=1402135 RepID=A0A073IYW7_9RHOB|nr:efflux transporter outer membrane subunit [Pseudosulfitobacter pseudonitzschiae]KEJ94651.1 RND transporter [Pseudosulfitobacter pseudonitzschiae]SHG15881.1 outer membrane protein, multidrug efflux system [Pseudosulfitobacter pseudonitzschiae]